MLPRCVRGLCPLSVFIRSAQAIAGGCPNDSDKAKAVAPAIKASFKQTDWAVLDETVRSLSSFVDRRCHLAAGAGSNSHNGTRSAGAIRPLHCSRGSTHGPRPCLSFARPSRTPHPVAACDCRRPSGNEAIFPGEPSEWGMPKPKVKARAPSRCPSGLPCRTLVCLHYECSTPAGGLIITCAASSASHSYHRSHCWCLASAGRRLPPKRRTSGPASARLRRCGRLRVQIVGVPRLNKEIDPGGGSVQSAAV